MRKVRRIHRQINRHGSKGRNDRSDYVRFERFVSNSIDDLVSRIGHLLGERVQDVSDEGR
jgi:hypothetical protein